MLPASVWFVHDRVDGLELGPYVLVVDGLELVNELELGPDVLAVDGLELVNAILVLVHKYIATCTKLVQILLATEVNAAQRSKED